MFIKPLFVSISDMYMVNTQIGCTSHFVSCKSFGFFPTRFFFFFFCWIKFLMLPNSCVSNILDLLQKQLKNGQMTTGNLCRRKPKMGKEINTLLLQNGSKKGGKFKG